MKTKFKNDRRKILLFIPLLVVPFLALAFYAMGGGTGSHSGNAAKGLNTNLPDASFSSDTPKTKADYYSQAERNVPKEKDGIEGIAGQMGFLDNGSNPAVSEDDKTRQINEKLEALNKEITRPEPAAAKPATAVKQQSSGMSSDVDRLEKLMKTMQENKSEDPEMTQLNGMMQSILDIQHPERVQQRIQFQSSLYPDSQFRATPAVIAVSQKVVQGSTVKLILMDTLRVGNTLFPKGQEVFGSCRITNQRLLLDIKNIRLGTSIVPVDLSVYSFDGMIGIAAPEAELAGALSGGTDDAVRSIGIGGFDNSVGMQVAGAGIDAARQLISKKVRKIKVKLNAGMQILIRNNKLKNR